MKGTYLIAIYVLENSVINIGALGEIEFIKGNYLYIGSAMGNKGSTTLENRVKRHVSDSKDKKIFWHIDYLLANINCIITRLYLIPSLKRLECNIANEVSQFSDRFIRNFGSSDCECPSHLYYFQNHIDLNQILKTF